MPAFGGFSLSPDILARIEAANKAAAPSPVAAPVAAQQFVMPDLFDTGFDYADPFADTTADAPMRQVAPKPTGGVVGINPPPATPPAEKNRNNIGISPITTEGAVRVQSAAQPADSQAFTYALPSASAFGGLSKLAQADPIDIGSFILPPDTFSQIGSNISQAVADKTEQSTNLIDRYTASGENIWTDSTGTYSIVDPDILRTTRGGMNAWAPLNAEVPKEGGQQAAVDEFLNYINQKPDFGNASDLGDVLNYGTNIMSSGIAILGEYGGLGVAEDMSAGAYPNAAILNPLPANITDPNGRRVTEGFAKVNDAFEGAATVEQAISNYTGIENFQRSDSDDPYESIIQPLAANYIMGLIPQSEFMGSTTVGSTYLNAIEDFYRDPLVISITEQYGKTPTRSTKDGSRYIIDPLTGREIRPKEAKYSLGKDLVKGALSVGIAVTAGAAGKALWPALGGTGGAAAAQTATTALGNALGQTAITTAIQGGLTELSGGDFDFDAKGFLTSALLKGAGDYASGLDAAADEAYKALNTLDIPPAGALETYNSLNTQANIVNALTKTASGIKALESDNPVGALAGLLQAGTSAASGFQAEGFSLFDTTKDYVANSIGRYAEGNKEIFGLPVDDLTLGAQTVATGLLSGKKIDAAVADGLREYAKAGGTIGDADNVIEDALKFVGGGLYENVLKPAGTFVTDMYKSLEDALPEGADFDTPEGIKAVEDALKKAGASAEDAAKTAGSKFDDVVMQPVKEAAEEIYEPLETPDEIKAIEDAARVVGSGAEDAARAAGGVVADVGQAIKEGAEAIYEPIDAPDIDINGPDLDFNLPDFNIDLSGMFDYLTAALPSQKAPTVKPTDPVYADLSDLMLEPVEQEELLAESDYLERLLRTI